jgi:hypothetical protein
MEAKSCTCGRFGKKPEGNISINADGRIILKWKVKKLDDRE